jgi:hypothetical protein
MAIRREDSPLQETGGDNLTALLPPGGTAAIVNTGDGWGIRE